MHVTLILDLNIQTVNLLDLGERCQRADIQNLGLTSREHCRTVDARQQVNLGRKRTNLGDLTAVRALVIFQDHLSDGLLLILIHRIRNELNPLLVLGKCLLATLGKLVDRRIAALLVVVENSDFHLLLRNDLTDGRKKFLRNRSGRIAVLLFADFRANLGKELNELLVDLIRLENRIDHNLLRNFLCTCLDHDDLFGGACNRELQFRVLLLRIGRVEYELAVNQADLRHGTGTVEGNIGDGHCQCGAEHSRELGGAIRVYAHHQILERHIVPIVFREQRAHRAVNDAVRQNRILGGLSLTLHKAAGNLADSILALIVFDGEREEINPLSRLLRSGCRGEHNGIAVVHQHSAVGLCTHSSDFCRQGSSGKFHAVALKLLAHVFSSSSPDSRLLSSYTITGWNQIPP